MKILLAEDDNTSGNYITKGLASAGHTVDWVKDGREALAAGLDGGYDVAVVDRMIPDSTALIWSRACARPRYAYPSFF